MRIIPNSVVKFLRGVPLDEKYNHSIYFESKQMQQSYFEKFIKMPTTWRGNYYKFVYEKTTYMRNGNIMVGIPADLLYDVNYLMFQNTAFSSKWFYAFITDVKYVNDESSEITYVIDDLQTWFFDYELGQCFVEREHTSSDEIGEHIETEDIDTGAYMQVSEKWFCSIAREMAVVILYNTNKSSSPGNPLSPKGFEIDGIYTPYTLWWVKVITPNWEDKLNDKINEIVSASGEILAINMIPMILGNYPTPQEISGDYDIDDYVHGYFTKYTDDSLQGVSSPVPKRPTKFGNYIPRNNKLFTQQFTNLVVSNNSGATKTFAYERFRNGTAFALDYIKVPQPITLLTPMNYRFVDNAPLDETNKIDYDNTIPYQNFPQCCWSEDTYAKWWAQNRESYSAGLVSTIASGTANALIGVATQNYARVGMAAVSTVAGILDSVCKRQDTQNTPDKISGAMNSEITNYVLNKCGYTFYSMTVTEQYAKIIDTFFQSYGYAVKVVKQPRMDNRLYWTYVKTIGCNLHAKKNIEGDVTFAIPADTEEKICSLFDNGITFWRCQHDLSCDVGNYDRDNPPLAG